MATGPLRHVQRYLHHLTDRHATGELPDAELLQRFAAQHDEGTFAVILQRHGAMVFGVCWRVLRDPHDAADAFQATFLVFVRKAGSIRRREVLGSWLYAVAHRVALRLKAQIARQRAVERSGQELAGAVAAAEDRDPELSLVLHEELRRLPEKYRTPVVLCYLEGKTNAETAHQLGWPLGTVKARLDRARKLLRRRLARRGLAPSVAAVAAGLSEATAATAVPAALGEATVRAVADFAASRATILTARAALLAAGVIRTMFVTKLTATSALVLAVGALVAGGGWLHQALAEKPPIPLAAALNWLPDQPKATAPKPAERPKEKTHPISVSGLATDAMGRPIKGATVYLVSTNGVDRQLGVTPTDEHGRYRFDAELPLRTVTGQGKTSTAGTLQVYGTAAGHGFAWHGMRFFEPRPRPADLRMLPEDVVRFLGEPLEMNLTFGPAAELHGRVMDEDGRPVAGVKVRVHGCDYLDPAGKEKHHNSRKFWSLYFAPAALTTVTTGADGRFRLDGLPREVVCWIHVEHPNYARQTLYAATTDKPLPEQIEIVSHGKGELRPPVATGELKLTVVTPRRIHVRVVYADTGKPAAGMRVLGSAGQSAGNSSSATSDASGQVELTLPPGDYDLWADPPRQVDYVRTKERLHVAKEPAEQTQELRVQRGCVLILEAVDAATEKGIPGVSFLYRMEDGRSWRFVQSSTVWVDNPATDAAGQLRAVVYPGTGRYRINPRVEGYDPVEQESGEVELPAGKTVTVRFELRKQ